jgi:hypothetical protein
MFKHIRRRVLAPGGLAANPDARHCAAFFAFVIIFYLMVAKPA